MLTFQTESRQVRRKRERDQKKIARAMEKQEYQIIINRHLCTILPNLQDKN